MEHGGGGQIPFDILKKCSPRLAKIHGSENCILYSFRALMVEEFCALEEGNRHPCLHLSPAEHRRVPAGVHSSPLPVQAPPFPSSGNQVIGKKVPMCHTAAAEPECQRKLGHKRVCPRWPGEHQTLNSGDWL